ADVCNIYFQSNSNYPREVTLQVEENLAKLEQVIGARYGDEENPLLLSVRSGARVSMPGMMDTVLNLGLNEASVAALVRKTANERFVYDAYRRFVEMYGNVVMGVEDTIFDEILRKARESRPGMELAIEGLKELSSKLRAAANAATGKDFPTDPMEQLWAAISAVFESWNNPRAIAYREISKISHHWGTAVTVQAMVFGNMGDDSGTGVVFSRNPATGERELIGEFLLNA
ncbi:unnamed protein product, partial [marine sediment metagenome]